MGLRTMYDGITPAGLPQGGQLYAAYVDGSWPFYDQLANLFPEKRHVPISNHFSLAAAVLDFGEGSATDIVKGIDWVQEKRDMGDIPSLYCSASLWASMVRPSFEAAAISPPWWWGAKWDGTTEMFTDPFAVAHQYRSFPGYDVSVVKAYWPGIDPAPLPPKPQPPAPAPINPEDEDMANIIVFLIDPNSVPAGTPDPGYVVFYPNTGKLHPIDSAAPLTTNRDTFIKLAGGTADELTYDQLQTMATALGVSLPTPTPGA